MSPSEIAAVKEANVYGAADALMRKSDEWSAKFVGRDISAQQWLNLWNLECNVASACLAASKVGPESFRNQYRAAGKVHMGFAQAAYEKAGK